MPDLAEIYRHHPDLYEQMVRCEDYQGNLLPAIEAICPLKGIDVVELGAGTGRVTRLIAPHVRRVFAFDLEFSMLRIAGEQFAPDVRNWTLAAADHRAIPLATGVADLVIEGWAVLQMVMWHLDHWQEAAAQAISEMWRVLRPGGTIILIETLGTGYRQPTIPIEFDTFYNWLEVEYGFARTWIRTDFRFDTVAEAADRMRFFFGEAFGERVMAAGSPIVPECTGLWWRTV